MEKEAFYDMSYGLYIITSKDGDEFAGCIVNTVVQATSEEKPKLVVIVNKENTTNEIMKKSKKVNISTLAKDVDMLLIGKFGFRNSREFDKLKNTKYIMGENNIPIVTENVVSYVETDIIDEIDAGTHTVFILEATNSKKISNEEPLTYKYYHEVIKGKTPPKASSFSR